MLINKNFFLDLLFPISCLGCNCPSVWLCNDCFKTIRVYRLSITGNQSGNLDGLWLAADYRQPLLQKLLHSYKYHFIFDLAQPLSNLLINFLKPHHRSLAVNWVIPVPLAYKRRLWRGFNQAEFLAQSVSTTFDWPFNSDLLIRQRSTRPQVGLTAVERQHNLAGAFTVKNQSAIKGKTILLVDDVFTTGATLNECSQVLRAAGAGRVYGLVVAAS
jgi:competence protein ComFC